MGEQFWVMGQMAVDIFMLVLLAALLWVWRRDRRTPEKIDLGAFHPENLLNEMKQLGVSLEKNLEEKRTLTQNILAELEKLLSDAEEAAGRLEGLMHAWRKTQAVGTPQHSDTERLKKSAKVLFEKGVSKKEIARRLNIPIGELELMLKLQAPEP